MVECLVIRTGLSAIRTYLTSVICFYLSRRSYERDAYIIVIRDGPTPDKRTSGIDLVTQAPCGMLLGLPPRQPCFRAIHRNGCPRMWCALCPVNAGNDRRQPAHDTMLVRRGFGSVNAW